MINISIAVVLAYLLGSIPSAYLAGKLSKGIDLRRHGSGNLGATNAYRVLGSQLAVLVWLVDTAKGAASVIFLPQLANLPESDWLPILMGVAALAGHARPLFLRSGGGKGVATAAGVFLAIAWLPAVLAIAAWCLVLWRTGYVSLASLTASATLTVSLIAVEGLVSPEVAAAVVVASFVFWGHRKNIARLRNGEEHRFTMAGTGGAGDIGSADTGRSRS
jgi:glycerol-3-phosphate acyltransferase PlsY